MLIGRRNFLELYKRNPDEDSKLKIASCAREKFERVKYLYSTRKENNELDSSLYQRASKRS